MAEIDWQKINAIGHSLPYIDNEKNAYQDRLDAIIRGDELGDLDTIAQEVSLLSDYRTLLRSFHKVMRKMPEEVDAQLIATVIALWDAVNEQRKDAPLTSVLQRNDDALREANRLLDSWFEARIEAMKSQLHQ